MLQLWYRGMASIGFGADPGCRPEAGAEAEAEAEAEAKPRAGQEVRRDRKVSWPVLLLTLVAVTSSSLSALCLCHLLALQAEVEELRSKVCEERSKEQQEAGHREECVQRTPGTLQQIGNSPRSNRGWSDASLPPYPPHSQPTKPFLRKRSVDSERERTVSQPCLQMLADSKRTTFQKEFALEMHTAIPWQAGLKRGSALDAENDSMVVREEGYYFVYSQVYYKDPTFAMGHEVIRRKRTVVGDEPHNVILFRCIQNMNPVHPYNTCYTGGIVRLEVGDRVELLIPRSTAIVSLDGDSTFLGAVRLA